MLGVLHQRTTFPSSLASNLLSFVAVEPRHLLPSVLTHPPSANARRLKSGQPFVPAAQQLSSVYLITTTYVRRSGWIPMECGDEVVSQHCEVSYFHPQHQHPHSWNDSQERRRSAVSDVSDPACTNGVWAPSAACECGAEEQTVGHVVLQCPIHQPPHGLHGLTVQDVETTQWMLNTCPEIQCGPAADCQNSLKR